MINCFTLGIEVHKPPCKDNANQGFKYLIHTHDDVCRVDTIEDVLLVIKQDLEAIEELPK